MKFYGLICLLLIGAGLPAHCQDDLLEVFASPDDYDYDNNYEVEEEASAVAPSKEPPRFNINSFSFTRTVGQDVSFPCTSDKDQSEVLIVQKNNFDGQDLMLITAGDMLLKNDKRYTMEKNVFSIKDVKKSDSGYYSCVYQYGEERVNLTHALHVHFEPSVRPKKLTINVEKGQEATLNCRTSGNPTPKLTWKKQDARMPSGAEEEIGYNITFENVDRHVGGSYVCTADNGVGTAATAEREIVVSYPPEIRTENEMVHTGNTDRVELVCVVHAFPAAEVSWSRNGVPVDSDTRAEVHDGGHRHLLTIEDVSEEDLGIYTCSATNSLGSDEKDISITDAPSAPSIISDPHSAEESSYTLAWSTKSYYPIKSYELIYRKTKVNESSDEPGEWHTHTQTSDSEDFLEETNDIERTFHHTVDDLERATDYEAVLKVFNTVKPAEEVKFTFSTRKETAGQQQTVGGVARNSGATLLTLVALTSVAFSYASLS